MTNLYDKFDFIKDRIKDKKVLDIGCVQVLHDFSPEKMKETQHYKLRRYAKQLVGIDLEERGIKTLNELGYECYQALAEDVSKLNLGKFDVILLADVLEHIPDPCSFLTSIKGNLTDDGIIICTLPNALCYEYQIRLLLSKPYNKHYYLGSRGQHVAWYCKVTLSNLFRYAGYKMDSCSYGVFWKNNRHWYRPLFEKMLFRINEEYASQILAVFSVEKGFTDKVKIDLQNSRIIS